MEIPKTIIINDGDIYMPESNVLRPVAALFDEARELHKPYVLVDHTASGIHIYPTDGYTQPSSKPGTAMELLRGLAKTTCVPGNVEGMPAPIGAVDEATGKIVWIKGVDYRGTVLTSAQSGSGANRSGDSPKL